MKTGIVVQARMTSTRLPGKVLKPVCGKPLLEIELERLRRSKRAQEVVVATTGQAADDPVVELCKRLSVPFFRGSEDDVLSRFYETAKKYGLDVIARTTADCPVIDPAVIDLAFETFLEVPGRYDYVSNTLKRTYPRGLDVEVFSFKALEEAAREAKETVQREHVTPFIHRQPGRYKQGMVLNPLGDLSHHRWTVDVTEDFDLISRMIEALYPKKPDFSFADMLALLEQHPDWSLLNKNIEQKTH
ncbi:MAG: glycosyltransferase family protein [Deltaproteobacteria bacterium]|nr:glycosyltransferase family protein [Deltaproteobacteria bacterium]